RANGSVADAEPGRQHFERAPVPLVSEARRLIHVEWNSIGPFPGHSREDERRPRVDEPADQPRGCKPIDAGPWTGHPLAAGEIPRMKLPFRRGRCGRPGPACIILELIGQTTLVEAHE